MGTGPHSLLAAAVVAEDAFLEAVEGEEAEVLQHVQLRRAPPRLRRRPPLGLRAGGDGQGVGGVGWGQEAGVG